MSKAAKKKEEERIEKIIRNLLKLPENRRCINCTSLGPQYVCTTFWTFVCTNCSGVHREFTHRVKSVSMAKFSAEEVSALQAGGNERAREIYFKVWDPQRHTFPDGSNQNKLRDFIRQVYVDRKYAGESTTKPAVTKTLESKEEISERQSIDNSSCGGSKYHVDERRSPRYKQDTSRNRSRTARFEVVDDRFRDDDFGPGRRSKSSANRVYNSESSSPVAQKTHMKTTPPEVRNIKDILGEDIPPLRLGKSPEDNNDSKNNKSADPQEKSAVPKASVESKSPEPTIEKSVSLIDLMADPDPSDSSVAPQMQETAPSAVAADEGSVKSPPTANVSNGPQANSFELMLFELSAPGEVSGDVNTQNAASVVGEVHESLSSSDFMGATNDGSQLSTSGDISSATQQLVPPAGASFNQAWNSSPAPNTQSSSSAAVVEPSQPGLNITSQTGPRVSSEEAKSNGRGELPMDLFTARYPSFHAPVQNWQFCPPHGMGFNMYQHYPTNVMPGPSFPNLARSMNPFDLNDDATQAQTAMYPSMLPVRDVSSNFSGHNALPNVSYTNSSQFMQSQASPHQAMPHTQLPTYVSGAFAGQQLPYGMPFSGSQEDNGIGKEQQNDPFAALSPLQQRTNRGNTVPNTENSFSLAGGNPFG